MIRRLRNSTFSNCVCDVWFLQRVSIACYVKRCTSYRKSVRLSVRHTLALYQNDSSYDRGVFTVDSPVTLVSSWLISARNSKGNLGSEGSEWERGRKNRQFLANKSPYISRKRCKIGPKLLLITNRKSHMRFRLVPKLSTLNDLERPKRTLSQKRCVFWSPLHKCEWWYRPILSATKM